MKNVFFTLSLFLTVEAFAGENVSRSLASIKQSIRTMHARELLGKNFKRKISLNEDVVERNIFQSVAKRLPKTYKTSSNVIAKTIIAESTKHQLDPYFVMAVISGESSFNPLAVGPVGEIGLMQLRSATGEWMAKKINMPWKGDKTLRDPVANIKLGTAYLAWLRERFNGNGQLYVAAYNMGALSVKRAVGRNVYPKDYPRHVMKRYLAFYKEVSVTKL